MKIEAKDDGDSITLSAAEHRSLTKAQATLATMARYRVKGAQAASDAIAPLVGQPLEIEYSAGG